MTASFNDTPIISPDQDRFGFDPLANALARSISRLSNPEGTVFAVNGPWGTGKSSVINLIRHHLVQAPIDPPIQIINFACWWYRGEEALTIAFLQELFGALKPALPERARGELAKLAKRVVKAKDLLGPVLSVLGAGAAVELAKGAADSLEKFLTEEESLDAQQARLADELKQQPKRFLVIIDDLDRLLPGEALQVFRLIKSVGRLPNVMYLLAFDRQIAERTVAEKYPSEGPHYLEKIIQSSFELPVPSSADLNASILDQLALICGQPDEGEIVHFMNVFYDCVAPFVKSPRDVNRIANTLMVTWPAVNGDVNAADFIALETLRVFHAGVYRRLQTAKDLLAGGVRGSAEQHDRSEVKAKTEALLAGLSEGQQETFKTVLKRLFPRTQGIWDNISFGAEWDEEWTRHRFVRSTAHFNTYFAFAVGEGALPGALATELINSTENSEKLQRLIRSNIAITRPKGGTQTALMLDELNIQARSVPQERIEAVIASLYPIADELDVIADKQRGFLTHADNQLRLHWLTNRLVVDRLPLSKRSGLLLKTLRTSSIGWLVSMADRAYQQHFPDKDDRETVPENCLCTVAHAQQLQRLALTRIRKSSKSGELIKHRRFPHLLFYWHRGTPGAKGSEASRWFRKALKDPASALRVAEAFLSEGWSHSVSDRVARRNIIAGTQSIAELVSLQIFRRALEAAIADASLPDEQRAIGQNFLDTWEKQEARSPKYITAD